jgi:hypothetical protein
MKYIKSLYGFRLLHAYSLRRKKRVKLKLIFAFKIPCPDYIFQRNLFVAHMLVAYRRHRGEPSQVLVNKRALPCRENTPAPVMTGIEVRT